MVIVNSYSGTIVSYLAVPKMKKSVNTLEDLAVDESIDTIIWEETAFGQLVMVRIIEVFIIDFLINPLRG